MNHEIVDSFTQLSRERNIDRDVLINILEEVFGMMLKKKYGMDAKFEVVLNMDKGDIEFYLERAVVEVVANSALEVDKKTAKELTGENLEVGEDCVEILHLKDFGRRSVVMAKQNFIQRVKDIEKDLIFTEYNAMMGDIVVGEVYQLRNNDLFIIHNKNELILPKSEQIPGERFKKGDTIRAVVKEVRKTSGNPYVIVSRTDNKFMERLFELEIPEVYDGLIQIKAVARDPGERAKIAVESQDDRIDAVGACVGMKGVRIHTIVRELNNENIDVINYNSDPLLFIARALAPAKLKKVDFDEPSQSFLVLVSDEQASLAIGKGGQNIRLATKLTGFDIQIMKETAEYDIELEEFKDELGDEMLNLFIEKGYNSAKIIIETNFNKLAKDLDVDREELLKIVEMIKTEYDNADVESENIGSGNAPAGNKTDNSEIKSNG
ncbi:MAG: transcription termination factor NusA [Bacteroidetes bacterium]|nr:transcription termination factor NusA [Bacteroidota bacterium]